MSRFLIFVYGTASYLAFFATFLYAIGFIGNFGVPKAMDTAPSLDWGTALLIDLGLLALFAIQHSVMARPAFKRILTRLVPQAAERSTYVLASSLALMLLFWQWQPLGGIVWSVESAPGQILLYTGYAAGWLLVFITTFVINHFDLFGLSQVFAYRSGKAAPEPEFRTPAFYRVVRHPLYLGFLLALWVKPTMSYGRLLFTAVLTLYILVAIRFEERDLIGLFGHRYRDYQRRVSMIVPWFPRRGT
ncbi:MAG: isoprenylcysteine carboxylmethyltransferase family protein [Acidobacteria bacterium]|nr:isoprenylcysteine carboxylmethyltransferase family protein [Acidobacteriota bacterium]